MEKVTSLKPLEPVKVVFFIMLKLQGLNITGEYLINNAKNKWAISEEML